MTSPGNRTPIGGMPIQPDDPRCEVKWQASWLQDTVFKGVEYRELIHPNRKTENNGEIQNIHTLFRRELTLDDKPVKQACLYITADDCYHLYINGKFIGLGPAPAYPSEFPYNAWDVTSELQAGVKNCIGVHAFYHGMHSLTFPSGDNLQGMICQLEVEYDDGETPLIVSDVDWRCMRTDAYESRQVLGYQTAFSEHIDLRKLPAGWTLAGFDDGNWEAPLTGAVPELYTLVPQRTPPVATFRRDPILIVKKGEGHYFIDFGTELSGSTAFLISGDVGHEVEIRHGEELDGPESVRYEMRANCCYQEFCTLSGEADELLEFFDYKGFRYVEVLNWPEELSEGGVWANERHYPFPEDASSFKCSNELLNDIWALCRNGARVGTIDTYLDCPTREKGGFMGDGFVTGISHLILTGDARILRKFLSDVASTSRYCPGLHSTAPNYVNGELAEYSLLWPVLLEYYYQWTGDLDFLKEMMSVLEGLLKYYAGYENGDGLLQDVFSHQTKRYSVLVDWPKNLRDDYDDPYLMGDRSVPEDPDGVVNTMVQGFYSCALQASTRLAEIAGSESITTHIGGRVERQRSAVLDQLRDSETGLFIDRNGSKHSALHANVTPLMSGMLSQDDTRMAVDLIGRKRLSCGVYFSFFVLKALYEAGASELAYDLMTSHDLHSWHSMLEAGATTAMEAWAPDLKRNTSWCHPWSSSPVHMVAHELMGLRPNAPGWKEILFAPRPPASLESASIELTTPQGSVRVNFTQNGSETVYELKLPKDCPLACEFDSSVAKIVVNDAELSCKMVKDDRGIERVVLDEPLSGGEYRISVFKESKRGAA